MGTAGSRVLVTGGSGFIGMTVTRALRNAGADVTVVDRIPHPDPDIRSVLGDLAAPGTAEAAVGDGLTGIVHLAAVTSVLKSTQDPAGTYQANVDVTARLLELARARGVQQFLLASTNAVTGDVGHAVITEDIPLRPLTPYGATKAACEMLLSGYAASYGIAGCALRLTNVYGQGMKHKDSFVPRLMRAAASGETVQVYGDGLQRRDFVHVDDVAQAVLLAFDRHVTGSLIVGAGHSVSVLEMIDAARQATGAPLPAHHVDPKPGEMPAVVVDIARARALGFAPSVALTDGLATVWREFTAPNPATVTSTP